MNTIGSNSATIFTVQGNKAQNDQSLAATTEPRQRTSAASSTSVTISPQARALQASNSGTTSAEPEKVIDLTAFAYGALGFDDPEKPAEEGESSSYTAGKYLKGALTVGTILLAVV